MPKYYVCKNCGEKNKVDEKDFIGFVGDNAGPMAGRAAITLLAAVVTAPIGGIGGIVAGALFTAEGARDYLSLECGKCKERFFIKRWE